MMIRPVKNLLSLSVLFFLPFFSMGSETDTFDYPLVSILSKPENNLIHELILQLNPQGEIVTITRTSNESTDVFFKDELKEGVVLASAQARDAVTLGCIDCSDETAAKLRLGYLYNGITAKFRYLNIVLKKVDDEYELFTEKGLKIDSLTLFERKFLGQTIGISRIGINKWQP